MRLTLTASVLLLPATGWGQGATRPDDAELTRRIDAYVAPLAAKELSGTLLVARGNRVLVERSFGFASHELRVPFTPTTPTNVASITKPLTIIIVSRLVEARKLSVNDTVSKWLPEYVHGSRMTITQLLNHRAGVPHRLLPDDQQEEPRTTDDMVQAANKLPLLFEPAVLTRVTFPTKTLKLLPAPAGSRRAQQLLARESGLFEVEVQYQLQVTKKDTENGLSLPTQYGLINELNLTLLNLDVDVISPQAVSVQREAVGSNTVATLVLSPANDAWISWKPRSRDVKREKPVFYAEVHQLYVPSPGVIHVFSAPGGPGVPMRARGDDLAEPTRRAILASVLFEHIFAALRRCANSMRSIRVASGARVPPARVTRATRRRAARRSRAAP